MVNDLFAAAVADVLGQVAARVEEVIRERGTFRAVNRSGVFVCR